ncbi:MAG: helix-turn-helix transcriptional regulator [Lachnospiraceae bacterium]|nr:helix-turn-helix transcriptional regulator [Lachnospiraceae bacterium]
MTDQEVLAMYDPLVGFLSKLCGPSCEVLLHDVSNPKNSVIAIENGALSGRSLGSPLTDLAYRVMETGEYKTQHYLSNYSGSSKGRPFLSNTYFITNEDRLIGLLCINRDTGPMHELDRALESLRQQYNLFDVAMPEIHETLEAPVPVILENLVSAAIDEVGVPRERLTIHEKVAIVHKLSEQGVLNMRGSIAEIARQFDVSEPTIYRYINRGRK